MFGTRQLSSTVRVLCNRFKRTLDLSAESLFDRISGRSKGDIHRWWKESTSQRRRFPRRLSRNLRGRPGGGPPTQRRERLSRHLHFQPAAHLRRILAFVYSKTGRDLSLTRYLHERRRIRRRRGDRKPRNVAIPQERGIERRPAEVGARIEFGHWEGDLLIFRRDNGKTNIASLIERKSRYAVILKNPDRQSIPLMEQIIAALAPVPAEARRSFTFDRGTEFMAWRRLLDGLGARTWFCDPSPAWQKGSVENTNRCRATWKTDPLATLKTGPQTSPRRGREDIEIMDQYAAA